MTTPIEPYYLNATTGIWERYGRTTAAPPEPDVQFTRFSALDVFNEVKIPYGRWDSEQSTVGCRIPDASLSNYAGTLTLTSTSKISGLNITGPVTGRGGTMTDCVLRGWDRPHDTFRAAAYGTSYDFGGALFEWCTWDLTGRESMFHDNIQGGGYTVRYCDMGRGVDGLAFNTTGNAVVEMSRICAGHYESWWDKANNVLRTATFVDYGGRTIYYPFTQPAHYDVHGDGSQIQGYSGWVIRGCHIGGTRATSTSIYHLDPTVQSDWNIQQQRDGDLTFNNAAIMINARATKPALGLLIEYNILRGGASRVNFDADDPDYGAGVIVRNNLFERGGGGYMFRVSTNYQLKLSNNLYRDNRQPVPLPGTSSDSVVGGT